MNIKLAAFFLAASSAVVLAGPVARAADASSTLKMVDTDNDKTIDMAEADKAAMAHFKAADTDHEGTLDSKEAGMNVSAADPDKDGTLDQAEYKKAVATTFKDTDTDNDGTVDAKELATPAGEKLSAMMGGKE